jgi:hypothetical protein
MADKPILFSGPMVRAILDGRKTQTRRVLKPQLGDIASAFQFLPGKWRFLDHSGARVHQVFSAPFANGDRLWVREAWHTSPSYDDLKPTELGGDESILYAADGVWESWGWGDTGCINGGRKRPSIFMPRWASRLTLIVEDVRVQRLQVISRGDAMDEGCPFPNMADGPDPRDWFHELWDGLNAARGFGWDVNPWVAAVTFRTIRANIDSEEVA